MREPHIDLKNDAYGIRSLVIFRPETGAHLYNLVQVLLRGPSPLTEGERELIAAYVSNRNECVFCMSSHAAAATELLGSESAMVSEVLKRNNISAVGPKLRALLNIAGKVQVLGTEVHEEDIAAARAAGAGDLDIHDTVLIAAVFSMFNRYVDGLNTTRPDDVTEYVAMGKRMSSLGYVLPGKQ